MTEPSAAIEEKSPKPKKRLTPRQWAEAEALWAAGDITLRGLIEKYGLQKSAFVRHFQKIGLKKGEKADEIRDAAQDAIKKAAEEEAALLRQRILETKEEHYKMAAGIAKLTWAEIVRAKSEGIAFGAVQGNIKALELAMNALKKAREERYACLGLDKDDYVDEDELPELVIAELTDEQIAALRERDRLMEQELGLDDDDDEAGDAQRAAGDNGVVESDDDIVEEE
ncbi:hypothetical protein ACODYM_29210 [Burkholderia gladioli]|uniref:hypothetical protein n=1 Tax=Burkholderia gladioli TaxID=28095 RepID=UPI003B4FFB9C